MNRILSSHISLHGCLHRVREAVFWLKMNKDIEKTVAGCRVCATIQRQQAKELLMPHEISDVPWQRAAFITTWIVSSLFEKSLNVTSRIHYYNKTGISRPTRSFTCTNWRFEVGTYLRVVGLS